jgi:hypothetical protein
VARYAAEEVMSPELKAISPDAIPRALEKADRYRLLNEPLGAESICLDILATEPTNQEALVILLLALTDQFGHGYRMSETDPQELIARLIDPYEKAYYAGIILERQAQTVLEKDKPDAAHIAHDLLLDAMQLFEKAAAIRPAGNDDALLRWNTCARMVNSRSVQPRPEMDELPLE